MNITLRARERLYLNGAVIRVDRKTTIELMNDATFLLENHVIQAQEATTPLRQIYFAVQVLLIDPASAVPTIGLVKSLLAKAAEAYTTPEILAGLKSVEVLVGRQKCFEALKTLRNLYAHEQRELQPADAAPPVDAASLDAPAAEVKA